MFSENAPSVLSGPEYPNALPYGQGVRRDDLLDMNLLCRRNINSQAQLQNTAILHTYVLGSDF
jgi:hypothetical protein